MTLSEVKELIRASTSDVLLSSPISDTELNMLIYVKMQDLAKLINDYDYEFYKEKIEFEQNYSGFGLVDRVAYSAEIFIYKLVSAYLKSGSDLCSMSISTVDGVHQDTLNQNENGSIAFSNAAFYVHPPTEVTGDYNLYCTICSYPQMPADDTSIVNVLPQFLDYLVSLCKRAIYEKASWSVPKSIFDNIALNEYRIINKA